MLGKVIFFAHRPCLASTVMSQGDTVTTSPLDNPQATYSPPGAQSNEVILGAGSKSPDADEGCASSPICQTPTATLERSRRSPADHFLMYPSQPPVMYRSGSRGLHARMAFDAGRTLSEPPTVCCDTVPAGPSTSIEASPESKETYEVGMCIKGTRDSSPYKGHTGHE